MLAPMRTHPTNTFRRGLWLRLGLVLLWTATITVLSLVPSPPRPPGLLGWDKLQHAGAYGLLALLLAWFLVSLPRRRAQAWWLAMFMTIGFGVLMECLQLAMAMGRSAEWLDLVADSLGALGVCVIFRQVLRSRLRQLPASDPPQ